MRAFHPEDIARTAIDARLGACGWLVQSRDEISLSTGTGIAVREFATGSGPVDYALFVDKRFCGVVEAKPAGTTLSGFSEQAARYIADAPDFLGGDLRQRRFEYVASDTETLFRDLADPEPRSRRVFAFHRPETFRRWLSEPETLRARLRYMPTLVTDGLRQCQIEAIEGLERSLARADPRALVQMTMGAGKTFTACTASYRVLSHAGMRRVVSGRSPQPQQSNRHRICRLPPPGTGRLFPELYGVQKAPANGGE
jgi:type I restriction enzyme, R subunit